MDLVTSPKMSKISGIDGPKSTLHLISCLELVGDILEQRPKESDSLDTVIIVDNIPVVGPDRVEKLKNIIRKVFSKFGNVVNEYYPEKDGKTTG